LKNFCNFFVTFYSKQGVDCVKVQKKIGFNNRNVFMKTAKLFSDPVSFPHALLLCASLACLPALGQTIPNPSFEVDAFGTFPGYISVNTAITGWTGSPAARVGVNSAAGPFADNGTIPNGSKAAFIQSATTGPSTLSTVITGLTNGQAYTINFRFNSRAGQQPVLKIGVDGQPAVSFTVSSVGGSAAYKYAALQFIATADTAALSLTNDVAGDTTVIVDDFTISAATSGWSFAPWNDDATSGVNGTKTYAHAYNFGVTTPDATINGVTFRGLPGANPTVNNEFRITGLGNAFGSDDVNNINTGGSATIARQFIYGGNPGVFTLMGLMPGTEYVATFYAMAWETGFRAQTFSCGNDRLTVNEDQFGENNGIRISYRFIAPSSGILALTQTPTLAANTLHLYGFANYEVVSPTNPVVGLQPRSQTVVPGGSATFKIVAGGARPFFYQWFNNGALLTDQTNQFLTVSNLTVADVGPYWVTVSNAYGVATSSSAGLTFGMIANPSFESDLFDNYPGYVSGNSPISGWTVSDPTRVGLNPTTDGQAPFANTGTIPHGQQAAFIQYGTAAVSLSTVLNGLTPNTQYLLKFRANARDFNSTKPILRIGIDGQPIGDVRLLSVGGASAWTYVSLPFTPANATATLSLTNDAADTALVDDFTVVAATSSWSYAAWNDDASSGVDSSRAYSHAVNFGGAGLGVDTTINGVRFLGVPGASPAVSNSFATAGLTGVFGAHSNALFVAGGGSAALGQSFVYYGGTIPAETPQSITLTNLVPGVEYLATIFGVGFDVTSYARSATFTVGEDRLTINEDSFGLLAGIRVSYRYVADASGSITLKYFPTERSSSFHTYGFCNAELTSTNAPTFYRQPQGRIVSAGSSVFFNPMIGGQAPLFLQWQKDGVSLVDQTNALLNLPSVTGADTASYTLVVSNAVGVVTSSVVRLEVGLALVNPSFEVDAFTVFPGYVSANTPITGWTSSLPVQTGINPMADGQSPFANNGVIPDGAKVAFIQADGGTLSQVVSGMTVGATYYLKFYENFRSGYAAPSVTVTLGGQIIVPTHTVAAGGYGLVVSGPFLATSDSAELAFIKSPGPNGGDSTLLLDSVAVLNLPPTAPNFLIQPQGSYLPQGDALSLVSLAQGTLPMSYRWQRDGVDVQGAVGSTLAFNSLVLGDGGHYQVIVSNQFGMLTSAVVTVQVGLPFTELFNTGVGSDGAFLDGGVVDLHYRLVSSADPSYPGPAALTMYNNIWPVQVGVYPTNGPTSSWISPRTNSDVGNLVGDYVYRTSFVLDTTDPTTARLDGKWAMDNYGVDIRLNGVSLGITNNTGFANMATFVITNGFVAGSNVLDFVINNAGAPGPTAMRVELHGVAMPLVGVAPQITGEPANTMAVELQDARLTALAIGSAPLSYQWYYEGFLLPGQTGRNLDLTRVSVDQSGAYFVVVTNLSGSATSTVAQLVVLVPPTIDVQPESQLVPRAIDVTMQVTASGSLPLSFQWYWGTNALIGATNSALVITNVASANGGEYQVVVMNGAGSVTSTVAVLAIANTAPDAVDFGLIMRPNTTGIVQVATLVATVGDAEADLISLVSVSPTSTNGAAVVLRGGEILYTPAAGFTGVDRFSYTVTDGDLTATADVVVLVTSGALPALHTLTLAPVTGGYQFRFMGNPGRPYQLQQAPVITGPWQTLSTEVAPVYGIIDYTDMSPLPAQAFYRVISPQP
jgi:hypothetical protein